VLVEEGMSVEGAAWIGRATASDVTVVAVAAAYVVVACLERTAGKTATAGHLAPNLPGKVLEGPCRILVVDASQAVSGPVEDTSRYSSGRWGSVSSVVWTVELAHHRVLRRIQTRVLTCTSALWLCSFVRMHLDMLRREGTFPSNLQELKWQTGRSSRSHRVSRNMSMKAFQLGKGMDILTRPALTAGECHTAYKNEMPAINKWCVARYV